MVRTLFLLVALSLTGVSAVSAEIIIESIEDGQNFQWFSTEGGKWNVSTSKSAAGGLRGTKSKYDDANDNIGAAIFKPELPAAGRYEVFITYPQSGNASGVVYKVHSAEGDKETALDQNGRLRGAKPPADTWHSLGVFQFRKGTDGYVEIRDPGTGARPNEKEPNARVYADAVKFVPADGSSAASAVASNTGAPSMPSLPAIGPGSSPGMPALPTLPSESTPAAPVSSDIPSLPTASSASVSSPSGSGLPSLPSEPGPSSAASSGSGLPSLPTGAPTAGGELPSLPTAGSSPVASSDSGLPPLPSAGSSPAPALTAATASSSTGGESGSLPSLPSASGASSDQLPGLPGLGSTAPSSDAPREVASLPGLPGLSTVTGIAGADGPHPTPMGGEANSASSVVVDNSGLQWIHDIGHARNIARDSNKHMLVFFIAPGNRQVAKYENEFFVQPTLRSLLDQFVLVRIDFTQNTKVAYGLGIYGAGTLTLVDPKGSKVLAIEQIPATPDDLVKRLTEKK